MKTLLYALRFLTIIPIPYKQDEDMTDVGGSLACFPVTGALIGAALWGTARLSLLVFSPLTTGFLVLVASMILTGGLHLDGLSDLADGLGGGRTREKKLEIMKDSRIGAFGALTLIGFLLIKGLFLYELIGATERANLFLLILPPLWARGFAALIIRTFPSARPGGMGDFFKQNSRIAHIVSALGVTLSITAALAVLTEIYLLLPAMAGLFLLMLIPAAVISRILNGLTGDCYGALIEGAELLGICLLAILH